MADDLNLISKVILDLDKYNKDLENYEKNTKQTMKDTAEETNRSTAGMGKGFAKLVIGIGAVTGALKLVIDVTKKATESFRQQEFAETRLESIAKKVTNATDEQIKSLKELASANQELTTFGDEVIIAGQSQLLSFGLQTKSVELLTRSLADLLSANNGVNATTDDAINGANLLGKAFLGQAGALSKVGVILNDQQAELLKTGDEITKVNTLVEIMDQNYGGLAESLAMTNEGLAIQTKNAIGDLLEVIGQRFVPVLNVVNTLTKDFAVNLTEIIKPAKSQTDQLRDLVLEMKDLEEKTNPTAEEQKRLQQIMNEISILQPSLVKGYTDEGNAIVTLQGAIEGLNKLRTLELLQSRNKAIEERTKLIKEENIEIEKQQELAIDINKLKEEEQKNEDQINKIRNEQLAKFGDIGKLEQTQIEFLQAKIQEINGKISERNEQLRESRQLQQAINEEIILAETTASNINDILEDRNKIEKSALGEDKKDDISGAKAETDLTEITEEEQKKRIELSKKYLEQRQKIIDKSNKITQDSLDAGIDQQVEDDATEFQKKLDDEKAFLDEKLKYNADYNQYYLELKQRQLEEEERIEKERSDITSKAENYRAQAIEQSTRAVIGSLFDKEKTLKETLAITLKSISEEATVQSIFELAKGIGATAIGSPTASAHFTASATYATTAVVAGTASASLGGFSGGASPSSSPSQPATETAETIQNEETETRGKEIFVNASGRQQWIKETLLPDLQEALDENGTLIIRTGEE